MVWGVTLPPRSGGEISGVNSTRRSYAHPEIILCLPRERSGGIPRMTEKKRRERAFFFPLIWPHGCIVLVRSFDLLCSPMLVLDNLMLKKAFILLTALLLSGVQWNVLQVIAWSGMIVNYFEQTKDIDQALKMTFDGEHPCCLCKTIAEEKQREQDDTRDIPLIPVSMPIGIVAVSTTSISYCAKRPLLFVLSAQSLLASRDAPAPPTPPPIA